MSAEAVALALAGGAVDWDGTDLGLLPRLPAEEEGRAVDVDQGDVPALLDALDSTETFVTAHVLLTRLAGGPNETFPTWNGLAVEIRADGSTHVDPAQRPAVAERWRRWRAEQ
ncbi:hypothetical protein [Cellulomonas terrae]|uniref:Uncharacterized protein n=1 Tax=Cellulomonas terrae TaxID=311234 RepID=A0A511JJG3_9CELL|nr:hypothetical protein [Cellulomonas terrae]GEL98045.1 hypothetical protein CTE05_15920 [Cellulomonas terrae]